MCSKVILVLALGAVASYGAPAQDLTQNSNQIDTDSLYKEIEAVINSAPKFVVVSTTQSPQQLAEAKKQDEGAYYSFETVVENGIDGNSFEQQEKRVGSKVIGKYAFDDGHNYIVRYYIADQYGFRIVK